jgi:hypothetical protein
MIEVVEVAPIFFPMSPHQPRFRAMILPLAIRYFLTV